MISEAGAVTLNGLQAGFEDRLDEVRTTVGRLIAADFTLISDVNAHLLQMQGKLFRPTIVFLVDDATGGKNARAVNVAAVVELIHLATLVHDDSVDHSVLRRGMPTSRLQRRSIPRSRKIFATRCDRSSARNLDWMDRHRRPRFQGGRCELKILMVSAPQ